MYAARTCTTSTATTATAAAATSATLSAHLHEGKCAPIDGIAAHNVVPAVAQGQQGGRDGCHAAGTAVGGLPALERRQLTPQVAHSWVEGAAVAAQTVGARMKAAGWGGAGSADVGLGIGMVRWRVATKGALQGKRAVATARCSQVAPAAGADLSGKDLGQGVGMHYCSGCREQELRVC